MTAATGLKRLAIAVAGVVAAAFVTLVALSFLIPAAAVREAVKAEIHAVTGLDPMLGDDVSLSLFPSGTVRFRNVLLGNNRSTEPAVAADELTARLRYFPLLAGRIEIADVTLVRPVIDVTFSATGQTNWSGLIVSLAHALQPNPGRTASFSEIGIQDGTVVVHDQGKDATERLEERQFSSCLAVDLAKFRRQRSFCLEQRAGRSKPHAERLSGGTYWRSLGGEAADHQRPTQCRLRWGGNRSANTEAQRHARRRVAIAA